jgi:hypothetical protein
MPETVTVKIDEIQPYWRNPRRIPQEAIDAVKESLERYGYQQPIVVDEQNVIIVGHTRHLAMKELGVEQVEVYRANLPEEKAKEFRLIDNRIGELGQWDHAALVIELREMEEGLLERFFPDIDLEVALIRDEQVTAADVEEATQKALSVKEALPMMTTSVECPSCYGLFEVRTESLPGLSRDDLKVMESDGTD